MKRFHSIVYGKKHEGTLKIKCLFFLIITFFQFSIQAQNVDKFLDAFTESYKKGDYREAAINLEKALPELENLFGKYDTAHYVLFVAATATCYQNIYKYDEALPYRLQTRNIYENAIGKENRYYATSCNDLAALYRAMGNYKMAETLYNEAKNIYELVFGNSHPVYSISCNNLALLYMDINQYEKALPLLIKAKQIDTKEYGKEHPNYAYSCSNLASAYKGIGQYEKAELLDIEAKQINENVFGKIHPNYASSCNNLGVLYYAIGEYYKAELLLIEAKEIRENVLGKYNLDYTSSCDNLARVYIIIGDLNKAKELIEETKNINEKLVGKNSLEYAYSCDNLAIILKSQGLFTQAEKLFLEVKSIKQKILGQNNLSYFRNCSDLAGLYQKMAYYNKAEELYLEAKGIGTKILGNDNIEYATLCNNLGGFYYRIGQYHKAEEFYLKAIAIYEFNYSRTHAYIASCYNNLGLLYAVTKNFDKAESYYLGAKNINEEVFGKNHPEYSTVCDNLAGVYTDVKQYNKAEHLYLESKNIRRKLYGKDHYLYAHSINNLAVLFNKRKQHSRAFPLFKEAIEIYNKQFGRNHPLNITGYQNLAETCEFMGNIQKANSFFHQGMQSSIFQIDLQFTYLTEEEMIKYLNMGDYRFSIYQSYIVRRYGNNSSIVSDAYLMALYNKGKLLNSNLQTKKSILLSDDTTLLNLYNRWIAQKTEYSKLSLQPISNLNLNLDSLHENCNVIEKKLTKRSKEFTILQKTGKIRWEDIRSNIDSGEISIEFISFQYFNMQEWTDSTLYCALVLRKDFEHPKIVYLFEERQLNPLLPSASGAEEEISKVYSLHHEESKAAKIYNLIWSPLEPYLEGVEKVYISASGELNKLAFHALPDTSGRLLFSKYNLVQLSSTREVALSEEDNSLETFAVFGGVDYSLDTTEMLTMAQELTTYGIPRAIYRGDTTARGLTLSYLPGTMEEAREIERECNTSGKEVEVFTGKLATEENFRSLGESESPDVIHIATHGFYFPEEETRDRKERMRFMQTEQENQFIYSPDPLIRSGLALAGANHAWQGEKLPEGVEDGILTARDVSRMNLINTELVVLSACQTGLGDVKGSEGVYGLQRAFKMAGVRYLLMSLWKVPDESTKEFMVTFYKQFLSGESIRDSYQTTQQVMSAKYPDDPFRWAAFVLVE